MQRKVIQLFNEGYTGVQISKETGIGQTKVSEIISKSFKKRVKNEIEEEIQGLGILYENGMRGQWLINRFYDIQKEMKWE